MKIQKSQVILQKKMQQLSDAIDQLPNNLMLWDKDYNLVMANQEAKIRLKENINFDIHPGVSRKDMISTAINSGFIVITLHKSSAR